MRALLPLVLLLAACSEAPSPAEPITLTVADGPTSVAATDTLSLSIPSDITAEVAVLTPDGEMIYLHAPDAAQLWPANAQPAQLQLDIATAQGQAWRDGQPTPTQTFTTPGTYQIIIADNLETEPENTTWLTYEVVVGD